MAPFFIGVDEGTHTRAVVADATLAVLGRDRRPANAATRALPRVVQAVTDAVSDAAQHARVDPSAAAAVACGLAGVEAAGIGPGDVRVEEHYGQGRSS